MEVRILIVAKKDALSCRMAKAGFTGAGLAKAAGISQGYVVLILSGKRSPLPPIAKKICTTLRCDFDDIFTLKNRKAGDDASSEQ